MALFSSIKIRGPGGRVSWAIQHSEPNGLQTIVGDRHSSRRGAELEVRKLNREAASDIAGQSDPYGRPGAPEGRPASKAAGRVI